MKIEELRDGQKKVTVDGMITELGERRQVNLRAGGTSDVMSVTFTDETGNIKLSLWNEQIELVKAGMNARVENGYVSSYNGNLQLNIGKFGHLIPA